MAANEQHEYVIGVDTGGTFTDIVALRSDGQLFSAKAATTPPYFSEGVMNAVAALAERAGVAVADLLGATRTFMHGSTVATNALITRTGASVGLITTAGFEDTIYIMRAIGRVDGLPESELRHVTKVTKPQHVVEPEDIVGVHERVDVQGQAVLAPHDGEVTTAVQRLLAQGSVEAVAVSLLNAWANAEHEELVVAELRRQLAEAGREVYVSVGHRLSKVAGEYARTNTAVLNAFIGPVVDRYLSGLVDGLKQEGFSGRFYVMQGNGGAAGKDDAPPIANLQSGPAAGMLAARRLAEALDHDQVITADMGGTSFDVGLLHSGEWAYAEEPIFERFRIHQPLIDVKSIGAGGGTIATVQADTGRIVVGPRSAGASPGPACYERGGTEATVTDADVVLGLIDPHYFLGGQRRLSADAAVDVIGTRIAEPLGVSHLEAAGAVFEIINNKMADLIRNEIARAGGLPETHVLYAFGGAGPLHSPYVAAALGINRVVVPGTSAVFSAMGAAEADVVQSHLATLDLAFPGELDAVNTAIAEAKQLLVDRLGAGEHGVEAAQVQYRVFGSLRYLRQTTDLEIAFPEKELGEGDALAIVRDFERLYEQRYGLGSSYGDAGIELSRLRIDAVSTLDFPSRELEEPVGADASAAAKGRRLVSLPREEPAEFPVYEWRDLAAGNAIAGPALVESELTTIAVPLGWDAEMDRQRNLILTVRTQGE